ncbi:MAG: alpha-ketoglutarate-dependent dioxygenase AlkB family protein [Akkermansiaceae bacterium]
MEKQYQLGFDSSENSPPYNVLPHSGASIYYGTLFDLDQANLHFNYLFNQIQWQHDKALIYGRNIVTARKVAWFGDRNYDYTYSGHTRTALEWTTPLRKIKEIVEERAGETYNSCLLNLYQDGTQGMAWHHDDEKGLGKNSNIASVSFGAERRFDFRHKQSHEKVSVMLEHGSLLVMRGTTQACWQHQIPKTKKVIEPRINLTFRSMIDS